MAINHDLMMKIRTLLVWLSAVFMIAIVTFQVLEIQKFELQDVIKTRVTAFFNGLFGSGEAAAAPAAPAAPAPGGAAAAPGTADGAPPVGAGGV